MGKHKLSSPLRKVESTTDTLASRGGLSVFSRYVEQTGILDLLEARFGHLRKSSKGTAVWNLFHQMICFFADGTSRHLTYFDQLKDDRGYAATIQIAPGEMASSHVVKRFFKLFAWTTGKVFRNLLKDLFIWRLHIQQPDLIVIGIDTMVMNNDDAKKRHGVTPTYKKVQGFQPIQFTWNGTIIDAVFRSGKWHANSRGTPRPMIEALVNLIRTRYREDVTIIFEMDAGFYDTAYYTLFDDLDVGFVASGKMLTDIKQHMSQAQTPWRHYHNSSQVWDYVEFGYKAKAWPRFWRVFYTRPQCQEQDAQIRLEFNRPEHVILTNLKQGAVCLQHLPPKKRKQLIQPEWIIEAHHQRSAEELTHRSFKDFGFEQLPFRRFFPNQALYYTMLLAFFLFQTFKQDVLGDVIPVTAYATTVRRRFIDIAAKVVRTGHQTIIKFAKQTLAVLKLDALWKKCLQTVPITAPTVPTLAENRST